MHVLSYVCCFAYLVIHVFMCFLFVICCFNDTYLVKTDMEWYNMLSRPTLASEQLCAKSLPIPLPCPQPLFQ